MPFYVVLNNGSRQVESSTGPFTGYENPGISIRDSVPLEPSSLFSQRESDVNFRVKIKRGVDATLPYTMQVCRTRASRLYAHTVTPNSSSPSLEWHGRVRANWYGLQPYATGGMSHDPTRDLALTRLKRKLGNLTNQVKLLPPLVECKELYALVRQACSMTTKVVRALRDIRRGRFRDAYRVASDLWLGYNFGVRPLLSDIQKTSEAIASYLARNSPSMARVTASANFVALGSTYNEGEVSVFGAYLSSRCQSRTEYGYRFTAGVDLKPYASNDYSILSHLGVSLPDLPSAAWELTAFSWITDYFATVGTFLEDTFSVDPFSTVYCVENRRVKVIGRTTRKFIPVVANTVIVEQQCTPYEFEFVEFSRLKLASVPVRSLRIKSRDEIGLNSVSKLLNLVAILGK